MPKVFLKRLVLWDLLLSLIWLITSKEFLRGGSSPTFVVCHCLFFLFHFSLEKSWSHICIIAGGHAARRFGFGVTGSLKIFREMWDEDGPCEVFIFHPKTKSHSL
jgi:hypothetical protein